MRSYANHEPRSRSGFEVAPGRAPRAAAHPLDVRPVAVALRSLQETSDESPRVRSQLRLQTAFDGRIQRTFAFREGWGFWTGTRPQGAGAVDSAPAAGSEEGMREEETKALLTADGLFGDKLVPLMNHPSPLVNVSIREGIHGDARRHDRRKSFVPEARPHQTVDISILGQEGGFHVIYALRRGKWVAVEVVPQGRLTVEELYVPGDVKVGSHIAFDESDAEAVEEGESGGEPATIPWYRDPQVLDDMVQGRAPSAPPPSYVAKMKKLGSRNEGT